MSRYYFNIALPGEFIRDQNGQDLPDLAAAQSRALAIAQRILGKPQIYGEQWSAATFHIVGGGSEVAKVPFSAGI
jgi:hypothetical protein